MAIRILWSLSILLIGTTASPLPEGQNLLITTPGASDQMMGDAPVTAVGGTPPPKIEDLQVRSEIKNRFAQTSVTSIIRNKADFSQELSFNVVLPQEAFVTGFDMATFNTTYRATLIEKSQAEADYGKAVESKKAGAMVSYRDANLFDISINVEAKQQVVFRLFYEQLLKREKQHYRHVIWITPGQVVRGMKVTVHILECRNITTAYSPMFSIDNYGNKACGGANMDGTCVSRNEKLKKTRLSENEVLLEFTPNSRRQKQLDGGTGSGMSGQIEVLYDVERVESGGEILVKDGYFVHFFPAPPTTTTFLPKHIIFVLDVSGSMVGRKMTQVKESMHEILRDLGHGQEDLFNIILFSDNVTAWSFGGTTNAGIGDQQVAFPANTQNIEDAKQEIDTMIAHGGTNIFDALKEAVQIAQKEQFGHPNNTKPVIFFLTDGEANEGITDPNIIISELEKINMSPKIPIYSFLFGEGGNFDFLKRLSLANSGVARPIYEDLDANIQLEDEYEKISHAVLSGVTFKYLPEEVDLSSLTKLDHHTLFEGAELVVSGRTIDKNAKRIRAEVTATGSRRSKKKFQVQSVDLPAPLYEMDASSITVDDPSATTKVGSMERAWAYLTIKQLLDDSKAADSPASQNERRERAIELAKKYSFASELTSFVVAKPSGDRGRCCVVAGVHRIIYKEKTDDTKSLPISTLTKESETSHQVASQYANLKTLEDFPRKDLPALKVYYKHGGLEEIAWLPHDARRRGFVEMLNRNGTFSNYSIMENVGPFLPEDEPDCEINTLRGKCRHLSQCIMKAIVQDYFKYRDHYQCELEDYLAVCCPHI